MPLCEKIATYSYAPGEEKSYINKFIVDIAKERNVKVTPLSRVAVELHGGVFDIEWMRRNYSFMLCAFDPSQEVNNVAAYMTCMKHSPEWVKIIQSDHPELLGDTEYLYQERCVR